MPALSRLSVCLPRSWPALAAAAAEAAAPIRRPLPRLRRRAPPAPTQRASARTRLGSTSFVRGASAALRIQTKAARIFAGRLFGQRQGTNDACSNGWPNVWPAPEWWGFTLEQTSFEVMFGGQAGDGSLTTGDVIAGVFKRWGWRSTPTRISLAHPRRAHELRHSGRARRHYGMADFVDCLVAFDLEAVQLHIDEMRPGGFIIFDTTSEELPASFARPTSAGTRSRSARWPRTNSDSRSCVTRSRSACSPP